MIVGTIKICLWLIIVALCAYMVCWTVKKVARAFINLFNK